MDYQSAEIVHWFKNKDTHSIIPAQVDIDLTNICNQDCFYCNSAIEIRNLNHQRIQLKNSIAEKLNCPVKEIKKDHLSE